MIHVASNPDSPQDDWTTICIADRLSPNMQFNEVVETAEIAEARRAQGEMVCGDCLPYHLTDGDDREP